MTAMMSAFTYIFQTAAQQRVQTSVLALLINLALSAIARADLASQHQSFDRVILPGGRAALLGGAYTALSQDPSGLLYNPAGSAFIDQNQVSLNTWSNFKSEVQFKEAINGQDFNEQSNTRFGGFAGGLFKHKPFTLGYLIATLDKRNINQDDYFHEISSEIGQASTFTRIHQESSSLDFFGVSLALAISKNWSLGLSSFYFDRNIEAMDYQQVEFNGGEVLVQESKIRVSNQGFQGLAGLLYKGESINFGLSLRRGEALINKGSLNFNSVTHPIASSQPQIVNYADDNYDNDAEVIPLLYRVGLAWHPFSEVLLSTDASYSAFTKVNNGSPDRQATWDYALGMEFGSSSWRLMMGLFTNNSRFPKIEADSGSQSAHLDYIGQSIGSCIITKSFDLYIGFIRQLGHGEAQIISGATKPQSVVAKIENGLVSWNFKL
ncbi:MAG: UPF0164 family protein [Proteobacteria bacterium]|nr:UPF0164 family protein [Pseudomonadota bacterium]